MENAKRVYCLYRVSTVGQVEKDDIPMQKQYCREFVSNHPDWHIEKELYEKGISGFKKSAKERDAIQEIQREAVQGKFEVLLVYMFDRLGRRDDETPFVVEWFVKNGIEVWSAVEGEQRLCRYLTEMNIRKPDGSNFPNTSINRIIKNPIYTGVIRNGEARSDVIPELQIIDPETFERAQKIMADRTTHHAETPLNLKGQSGRDTNAITMCGIRENVTGNLDME